MSTRFHLRSPARVALGLALALGLAAAARAATIQTLFNPTNSLSALVLGPDGNFYATTRFGGSHEFGAVVRLTPAGAYQQIYSFTGGADGANPRAGLAVGPDNNLYGACEYGGTHDAGTLFRISTAATFAPLRSLDPATDGGGPIGGLAAGSDDLLYGTTGYGGAFGQGTLFRISTSGAFLLLQNFSGVNGDSPAATLVAGRDDALYGTTRYGGVNDRGTVFRIATSGAFSSLFSFNGPNGDIPQSTLTLGPDLALYGTTTYGGSNGLGSIFRITTGGAFTALYTFNQENAGANPSAGLLLVDTTLHGTANYGGNAGFGAIFQITPAGDFTPLYNFSGAADGANPATALVSGTAGIYGTTEYGGSGGGTFFKLLPPPYFDLVQRLNATQVRYAGGGGTPGGPYIILTATNAATLIAGWTTNSTGLFDGSGRFSITNPAAPNSLRFFRLRAP